ncbi:uncharacterized protein BDV14DRAFT_204871 [Aspergillus stella-maris]|uniref:uncharacterized protein n=1 Tax=Aspergillus stella-maris TaxID=1810926 RepID=UPI003CCD5924
MGKQEGEDGHDVIEGLAKLPWCNGNLGLARNSHLGIVQWFIAATQPPSLKAIAPWEACGDLYHEQFVRGGAWDNGLFDLITRESIRGRHGPINRNLDPAERPNGASTAENIFVNVILNGVRINSFLVTTYEKTLGRVYPGFTRYDIGGEW